MKQQPADKPVRWYWWLGMIGVCVAASWFTLSSRWYINQDPVPETTVQPNPKTTQYRLYVGKTELKTEVRRTEAEQALGLSWRPSLGEDEAMAFVYARPQKVLYWMKGMQFPLDFIWVNNGLVTQVTQDVPHPTQASPKVATVMPTGPVDMVIEVTAGWVERHGVKVGDEVRLSNKY